MRRKHASLKIDPDREDLAHVRFQEATKHYWNGTDRRPRLVKRDQVKPANGITIADEQLLQAFANWREECDDKMTGGE